jgi:hypothetical protein
MISREIEAADLKARFQTVLARLGCQDQDLPVFPAVYPYVEGPIDLVDDLEGLLGFCERCELDLLILDPLSRLHSADENSAEKLKPVLASVDTIRERRGVAVLLCHHDRKGGQYKEADLDAPRGSSLLTTNPTVSMRLVEMGGNMRRLTFRTNHASTMEPVYLRPLEGGGFEVTDAPKKGAELGEENRQRIIDALKEHGPQGYADLAKRTGIPERTVRHHARALAEAGNARKVKGDGNRLVLQLISETSS